MRSVTWTQDNGQTIVFDANGPYYLTALTSDLGATAETVRAPRQNGATTLYTALDSRTINLTGAMWIMGDKSRPALAQYDRQRAQLHQIFAPHRWGLLCYRKEDEAVQVRCRPVATPSIAPPVGTHSVIDIDFVTDEPFWQTAGELVANIGIVQRFVHFPWTPRLSPMGAYSRFAALENPTQEPIYPTAEVYSTGQSVTLTNRTTGKSVTIEHAIADGQRLVIDLADVTASLYTLQNGVYGPPEDVSHWMSLDSDPWALVPGSNQISVTNDVPEDTPRTLLRYRIPRLGV